MVGGIKVSGTDLNRSMTADLATASKLYADEAPAGLLGNIISVVKGVLTLDIDQILNSLGNIVDLGLDLLGDIKDRILGFIYSLLGRDSDGLSKLSLVERSGLFGGDGACNFNLGNLNGINLNIAGYGISALLAMLLCAGIKGIFSLIDGVISMGIATVGLVAGAVSDVLKFIVGGDTLNVISDLGKSKYAAGLTQAFGDPTAMLMNSVNSHTAPISNPMSALNSLTSGMNNMSPNWLGGNNFNMNNVMGNNVLSKLTTSANLNKVASPILNGYNVNKSFNPNEKISMFAGSKASSKLSGLFG